MTDVGDRFINVAREQLGILDDTAPIPPADRSTALRIAIALLMVKSPPGGTVYLRPGRWLFGGNQTVIIPPEVTLMVAPGALIVPLNRPERLGGAEVDEIVQRPSLEIHGAIEASDGMFISTRAYERYQAELTRPPPITPVPTPVAVVDVGWVSFPTRAIETLYPEWWGAGTVSEGPFLPHHRDGVRSVESCPA